MICKNWNKWSSIVVTLALAVSICFVLPAQKAHAATYYSRATGDWTANTTWSATSGGAAVGAGIYPVTGDVVYIERGYSVTVDTDAACASITIRNTNDGNSSLTLSGTNSLDVSGAFSMNRPTAGYAYNVNVNAGSLTCGSLTMSATTATRNNIITISTGTLTVTGTYTSIGTTGCQLIFTDAGTIDFQGATTLTGNPSLTTVAGSTVKYSRANTQTGIVGTYQNLTLSGASAKTFATTPTVNGVLSLEGTATVAVTTGVVTYGANATLQYNKPAAYTATSEEWITPFAATGGVIIANTGTITLNANKVLNASVPLTINSGATLDVSATNFTLTLGGNFSNSGTFTARAGAVTFNGSSAQTIGGTTATTFYNMTVNNAAGVILGINTTVSSVLTLTNGDISTGAYIMEVSSSCATPSISGGNATSYVFGNLRLHYPTAAGTTTCTFSIGDASAYSQVIVAMIGVTSSLANSALTVRTDTPDHPDTTAGTSGIDKDHSVNRYWTLTPGGSLTFTTYNPTFYFVAGDIDSGATTSNFIIGRKNISGVWAYPTMSAANPLNTAATGITQANGFGEFAVGEATSISGTVFEDINYGGGAGRSLAGSSGAPVANTRVELYSSAGAFLLFTTTDASGVYRFSQGSGTYIVRVVSNGATGIRSTRTNGSTCTTCVPVETYHTDATSGTVVAVTDHVGGEIPTLVDAGDNTTSATLASLTTGTTTAQSITTVTKGTASITGVDFGFNFDTIVSIRDAGQGSLRQFIINANALGGEGTLTQANQTAGQETSIFMIPHHTAVPGQNTGYTDQLASGGANNGAAVITLTTGALPTISGNNTSLDATTQTANIGDTNSGTVGTGGMVGTMAQTLPLFNRPEVVIAAAATQLTSSGAMVIIKGLAISNGGITVNGNNSQVSDCLSGMDANGTVTTVYGGNFGVQCGPGTGILVSHNYVKINNSGIRGDSPGANLTIQYNEVDSPNGTPGGGHTNTFDGILTVGTASNVTVQYNLVRNQRGGGLEYGFAGGTVISGTAIGNTISVNGFTSAGNRSTEPAGVAVWQLNPTSALTIKQNVITGNAGPGIVVITATNVTITQNSIFSNGPQATDIGIDLNSISGDPNTYTAQGVTLNDMNDADTGPNNLLNYPIIESATISGSNLILKGWARPGSIIEFFIAAPDASGGFGSGKTYLTTLTEGSAADTDATSSTYGPGAINGILQGTDTTNRFMFTIALPGGVAIGTVLTATATLAGNTSEFSGNDAVAGGPNLFILKSANKATASSGEVITYTVQVKNDGPGLANAVTLTDSIGGYNALPVASSFTFIQGSPTSGLTLGTPTYSNDNGTTYTYTLVSGAGGMPAGYDGVVTDWKIIMNNNMNGSGGNFTINYNAIVK